MEKLTVVDAETKAREFIRERHPKVKQIVLRRANKKDNAWLIEGEVRFKRLHFFSVKMTFRLQLGSKTGEVTSYQETRWEAKFG